MRENFVGRSSAHVVERFASLGVTGNAGSRERVEDVSSWTAYDVRNLRDAGYEHVAPGWVSDVLVRPEQTDVGKVCAGVYVSGDAIQESWSQNGSILAGVYRGSSARAGYVLGALGLTWRRESYQRLTFAHVFNITKVAAVGISWRADLHVRVQDQSRGTGSHRCGSIAALDVKIAEVGMFDDCWNVKWWAS